MDTGERADAERLAIHVDLGDEIGVDLAAEVLAVEFVARAQNNEAVLIADLRLGLAHVGKQGKTQTEVPVLLQLARGVIRLGQRGDRLRVGAERLFLSFFRYRSIRNRNETPVKSIQTSSSAAMRANCRLNVVFMLTEPRIYTRRPRPS